MPFTNTPTQSTYQTKRLGFIENPQARSGTTKTQDQRIVNFFPELIQEARGARSKEYTINTRPGTVYSSTLPGSGFEARACVYFNTRLYVVYGDQIYSNGTNMGVTLGSSGGDCDFTLFQGTYNAVVLLDGVKGWVIKTDNSITQIVDADFPSFHCTKAVYIDGYLLVAKLHTQDIYNCDLDNPLSWTPGSFISADLYPDNLVALAKNNNYCYAIGESSVQFFYDAGIGSGSPFQRNDSAVQQMGCPAARTVIETDKEIIFVGYTDDGGYTVWKFDGFTPTEIGFPSLRESLDAEGVNIGVATAFHVRSAGHKFYVLQLLNGGDGRGRTWVYDFRENLWHEWAYDQGLGEAFNGAFPFVTGCAYLGARSIVVHRDNRTIAYLDETVATDQVTSATGIPFLSVMTTVKQDFDSMVRKDCRRLSIVGMAPQVSNTTMTISWSDDDYQTWSADRTLNINGSYSTMTQLGKFRRRAFKFSYNQPYPIFFEGYELDLNIGAS